MNRSIFLLVFLSCIVARAADQSATTQPASRLSVSILNVQTCDHLGACQGASEHDGFVYLYGDANPGVIRQYTVAGGDVPHLDYTGLEISLTRNGVNLINHPHGPDLESAIWNVPGKHRYQNQKGHDLSSGLAADVDREESGSRGVERN